MSSQTASTAESPKEERESREERLRPQTDERAAAFKVTNWETGFVRNNKHLAWNASSLDPQASLILGVFTQSTVVVSPFFQIEICNFSAVH